MVELREEALSFNQVISFEAFSAVTVFGMSFALIRDGDANLISIEDPSIRAFKANLVRPIPGSTSKVSGFGVVEVREDTLSFLKVISLEAFSAVTVFGMSFALIGNGNADFVSIEDPVFGAGKADLVIPVPGGASGVSGLGMVEFREDTLSFNQVISFEAFSAITILGMGFTLIRNSDTNVIIIKGPSF